MKNKGFTLIEMMVGVALVGFVSLMAYTFYINTFQFQVMQENQKNMQIRLQLAMNLLVSDIRAAGFGVIDPLDRGDDRGTTVVCPGVLPGILRAPPLVRICIPVTAGSGGAAASDTITLAARDIFVGTLASATPVGVVVSTITVNPPSGGNLGAIPIDDFITIGGFFSTRVADVDGNVITMRTALGRNAVYPEGLDVYTVKQIRYSIAANPLPPGNLALFRQVCPNPPDVCPDPLAADLVADGIEDLQLQYYPTGKTLGGAIIPVVEVNNPNDAAGLLVAFTAVKVSLIAQFADPDPNFTGGARPGLADRAAGLADNFRRAVLTRVVELPNDGCGLQHIVC